MLPITSGFLAGRKNRINAASANMAIETIEIVIHRRGIFSLDTKPTKAFNPAQCKIAKSRSLLQEGDNSQNDKENSNQPDNNKPEAELTR
jgi:hypothetical protein